MLFWCFSIGINAVDVRLARKGIQSRGRKEEVFVGVFNVVHIRIEGGIGVKRHFGGRFLSMLLVEWGILTRGRDSWGGEPPRRGLG